MNRVSTLAQSSQLTSQSFSRTDLQNSKVIAQIDTKFLACVLQVKATSERILVLVDQHAADERVRVERYLKRLCTGFIQNAVVESQLEPPVEILLSNREASILERPDTLGALSRWGLRIKINVPDILGGQSPTEESEFYQADVISVPDVVSKKVS
jgi:DNA mismatch repair protein MLH3